MSEEREKESCNVLKISRCLKHELAVNLPTQELKILVELEKDLNKTLVSYNANMVNIPEWGEHGYVLLISTMIIRIEVISGQISVVDFFDTPSFISHLNS